jgi:hypothetical protein
MINSVEGIKREIIFVVKTVKAPGNLPGNYSGCLCDLASWTDTK